MPSQTQSAPTLSTPAFNAFPITPSDSSGLTVATPGNSAQQYTARGLIVNGAAGAVQVTMAGDSFCPGQTVVFNLNANTVYPMMVSKVWSTNTTAASIVALI